MTFENFSKMVKDVIDNHGMPYEVAGWLIGCAMFIQETSDANAITHNWIQLGPVYFDDGDEDLNDPVFSWLKENQLLYLILCRALLLLKPRLAYRVAAVIHADHSGAILYGPFRQQVLDRVFNTRLLLNQ